jgi:hypothetical protein
MNGSESGSLIAVSGSLIAETVGWPLPVEPVVTELPARKPLSASFREKVSAAH